MSSSNFLAEYFKESAVQSKRPDEVHWLNLSMADFSLGERVFEANA
jgi:hypothetical protein